VLDTAAHTLVMGALNVTPDSFSDGGLHADAASATARGLEMLDEGADLVDIGGESTRPGAQPVDAEEEMRRVIPAMKAGGGYVASTDHSVPDSVSLEKFGEFVKLAKELGSYGK